jgi:hypothetical protein
MNVITRMLSAIAAIALTALFLAPVRAGETPGTTIVRVIRNGKVIAEREVGGHGSSTAAKRGEAGNRDIFVLGTAYIFANLGDTLEFKQFVGGPTDVATISVTGASPVPPGSPNTVTAPPGQNAIIFVRAEKIGINVIDAHGTSTSGADNHFIVSISNDQSLKGMCYVLGYCEKCTESPFYLIPIGSTVDNVRMSHQHDATDYLVSMSQPSCSTCSAGFDGTGLLPSLGIKRYHRYIDSDWHGSFGPGVFSNYDVMLNLFGPNQAELFDPQNNFALDFSDGNSSGVYINNSHLAVRDLRLYDAGQALTSNQANAATAVLTTLQGQTYTFEIFTIDGAATGNFHGRLTRIADRNGNALSVAYADPVTATDAQLNFDRSRLWRIATVTDAYGLNATFSYTRSSGQWVV